MVIIFAGPYEFSDLSPLLLEGIVDTGLLLKWIYC